MQRLAVICLMVCLATGQVCAGSSDSPRFRVGVGTGLGNLRMPEKPYFTFNPQWSLSIGTAGRYSLSASITSLKNNNSPTASNSFGFFAGSKKASLAFKSIRLGVDCDYHIINSGTLRPTVGFGVGYMLWKMLDPAADTVVRTIGDKDDQVDFKAAELYLSPMLGLDIRPRDRLSIHVKTGIDYLTGVGTSFSDTIDKNRGQIVMRAGVTVSWLFGAKAARPDITGLVKPMEEKPKETKGQRPDTTAKAAVQPLPLPVEHDADGDGVIDAEDRCPNTPAGAIVDAQGCPVDSDHDGVPDGLDDCPDTPPEAAGYIDIYGCPVDSDFDGVPDFRDSCPDGPVGAMVDAKGCPIDSDGDGVPDGLDDCPGTETGIEVDSRGCIDIAFLRDTVRIYINYLPGSFEIDERTKARLQPLVKKLLILKDVSFEIVGYSDNVGTPDANEMLSQKRANRMRDWLESVGIARERMTPVGRGEVNFLDSNDTAEGRTKNRRLELIFKTQ